MAQKTRLNDTNYKIVKGKTLIDNTNYSIVNGKTFIEGTNNKISLEVPMISFTIGKKQDSAATFTCPQGYTWEDLINSQYDIRPFTAGGTQRYLAKSGTGVCVVNTNVLTPSDL